MNDLEVVKVQCACGDCSNGLIYYGIYILDCPHRILPRVNCQCVGCKLLRKRLNINVN